MKKGIVGAILPIAALWTGHSLAQTGAPVDDTDYLSKETENPVTRKITVPLRYEADFFDGADKLTKSTIELDQAVVPFRLNDDWALITRTKLPAEALPPKNAGDHWADGLSNGYTTFFLSPEHGQGFYWGAGPVLYYPATNEARVRLFDQYARPLRSRFCFGRGISFDMHKRENERDSELDFFPAKRRTVGHGSNEVHGPRELFYSLDEGGALQRLLSSYAPPFDGRLS
jgi:hypothetical protein